MFCLKTFSLLIFDNLDTTLDIDILRYFSKHALDIYETDINFWIMFQFVVNIQITFPSIQTCS